MSASATPETATKKPATTRVFGYWISSLPAKAGGSPKTKKFQGEYGKITLAQQPLHLLKPLTFMNASGRAVSALAKFYDLVPEEILVVHDELDLPEGAVKLKYGGGHGGHNGLRDIIAALGSKDFYRLRLASTIRATAIRSWITSCIRPARWNRKK